MTPSSSMHGLSLINWLFRGIGLPKLKAAYSSRNVSRCAKLSPLQHPLLLRATIRYPPFCRLYCAVCAALFSLLRALEPNVPSWKTASDQVSTLHRCFYVSVQLLSEGYTSQGWRRHSRPLSSKQLHHTLAERHQQMSQCA